METSESMTRRLRQRAADGSLEVEHLIDVAQHSDASLVAVIRELQSEYKWPESNAVDGTHVVPFGKWADVVCCYLEKGCDGLVALATTGETGPLYVEFCVGLLEEIKMPESVTSLLEISRRLLSDAGKERSLLLLCAAAFNGLLSFKDAPSVSGNERASVRDFLHNIMKIDLSEAEWATVLCALRGAGDASSIAMIEARPPLNPPWAGLERKVVNAIKARLRASIG